MPAECACMRTRHTRYTLYTACISSWTYLYFRIFKLLAISTLAKKYSIRVEWLHQSGRALSEPLETPQWRITLRPAWIQCVALYIALRSLFHCLFGFCQSPVVNDHSGVVANCENTSEWVHWVRTCIGIAMRWVTLRISLLTFLLPARKMQFSLH